MVLRGKNRMGLRHFGQEGAGVFFGMMRTLDWARALPNSLSPIIAGDSGDDERAYKL
jgi:hypothetical protein